jgi:GNAT superfamily N-acetyltransferase
MSFVGKLLSVDQMLMAAAAVHPEAPPALPMIEACRTKAEIVRVSRDDRLARTALSQVAIESSRRYGGTSCGWFTKLRVRPGDTILVAVADGAPVAVGEYRRADDGVAEITRIWTTSVRRRQGLGSRILARLEAEAAARGHRRVLLPADADQSDIHALCRHSGYQSVRTADPSGAQAGSAVWGKDLSVVRAPLAVSA